MFSGVGGFEKGIEDSGIEAECVGYSEIDKYADAIYKKHYPNHKNYGDATKIIPGELPDFDLLVGGFPCQAFSINGKRQGFNDTRGTLFFDIARILQEKKPKHILLENVKGLISHDERATILTMLDTLTELGYSIQWVVLNSKYFGVPQNRERIFISGHLGGGCGRKILFEREPCQKNNGISGQNYNTVTSRYEGAQAGGTYVIEGKQLSQVGKIGKGGQGERIYDPNGISCQLLSQSGGMGAKTGLYHIPRGKNKGGFKDECGTLSSSSFEYNNFVGGIRRLTPIEAERLQGFPDFWTAKGIMDGKEVEISDSQRYKCLGNAVSTPVIKWQIKTLFA